MVTLLIIIGIMMLSVAVILLQEVFRSRTKKNIKNLLDKAQREKK